MNSSLARSLLLAASTLFLLSLPTACERAEPISYKIPKEDRLVDMPGAVAQAPQTPADPAANKMQVLPGMEEAAAQAGELSYTTPEGWETLKASGIRKANLKVSDAHGSAELTVLAFPGDVGGRLANINRWRAQIGLEASKPEDLPAYTEPYSISGHGGLYIRLEGLEQSILGGLLPFHGFTWFFKLQGNRETVLANEAQMKIFLDSVRLEDDHH